MPAAALTREKRIFRMDMTDNDRKNDRKREREREQRKKPPEEVIRRLNPRYVFNDPNVFFHDLLMEQQEQQ